ncbi:MAG: SGNH/GDSL hydrolase family protein, partial [Ilumatobacteraceae bacterium]
DTEASSVAMIGDSITQGSEDALRFTLTAAGLSTIDIDGLASRRIELGGSKGQPESGMQALERMKGAGIDPDVWVVALGTNDVGQYSDPEEYRRLIREILDALPDDTPLVWVDVYRADHLDDSVVFDWILRDELDQRGDATVVSWFDQASTRSDEILRKDGVHPNKQGNALFAGIVTQGVAQVT